MNKKERRKALFTVLSSKLANKQLLIVDKIALKEIKTKNMVTVFEKLPYTKNILLALPAKDKTLECSVSNIPNVKSVLVNYLNIKDLLKYNTLVLLKDSLDHLDNLVK
jgi:large subunit ribosomal protein L4